MSSMTIQQKITSLMIDAAKNRADDDKKAYRFLKGKFDNAHTQPVPDKDAINMLRSLYTDAKANPASFTAREIEIIGSLIPETLDAKATLSFLESSAIAEQIRSCPREGQAMGVAMKAFSQENMLVDSEHVKAAIASIRSAVPAPE